MSASLITPKVAVEGVARKAWARREQVRACLRSGGIVIACMAVLAAPITVLSWAFQLPTGAGPLGALGQWIFLGLIFVTMFSIGPLIAAVENWSAVSGWLKRKSRALYKLEARRDERQRRQASLQAKALAQAQQDRIRTEERGLQQARCEDAFVQACEALLESYGLNTLQATVDASKLLDQARTADGHKRKKRALP